jgi:hypothetical protein
MKKMYRILLALLIAGWGAGSLLAATDFAIRPYGKIKLDASWDQHSTSHGNFVMYVKPYTGAKNDQKVREFNMTAKETRLGTWIDGPTYGDISSAGRVEIDFYGAGATENKGHIMMRHAYIEVTNNSWGLIAGQTSDVISPLVATTLNYSVGWGGGNIGYRRPQIRISKTFSEMLDIQVAATRGIGDDLSPSNTVPASTDSIDDAVTSGFPHLQGRVATTIPIMEKKAKFGVSSHFGKLKSISNTGDRSSKYETWSLNADASIPIDEVLIKGELFRGTNLKTYNGSILNSDTLTGVSSTGGWLDVTVKPAEKVETVVGMGMEKVDDEDILASSRKSNGFIFANAQLTHAGVIYGLELSRWRTKYKNLHTASSWRIQGSVIYKFKVDN